MKLCLNGHEWAKRQLAKQGIAFAALDVRIAPTAPPLPRIAANDLDTATTVMLRQAKLIA